MGDATGLAAGRGRSVRLVRLREVVSDSPCVRLREDLDVVGIIVTKEPLLGDVVIDADG
jgi:hypothetical protein